MDLIIEILQPCTRSSSREKLVAKFHFRHMGGDGKRGLSLFFGVPFPGRTSVSRGGKSTSYFPAIRRATHRPTGISRWQGR